MSGLKFYLFLELYEEYGVLWQTPKPSQGPNTADMRHKIDGLITRLFCAERLPFVRTANHGCYR